MVVQAICSFAAMSAMGLAATTQLRSWTHTTMPSVCGNTCQAQSQMTALEATRIELHRRALGIARPISRNPAPMLNADPYAGMKRADLPLNEEVLALKAVGGITGLLLGPLLFRSALLGACLGVYCAHTLAFERSRRGARARELGYQLAKLYHRSCARVESGLHWMRHEASSLGFPEVVSAVGSACGRVLAELRAIDQAIGVSRWVRGRVSMVYAKVESWGRAKGITPRVQAAWRRSGVRSWLDDFDRRVEQRQRREE